MAPLAQTLVEDASSLYAMGRCDQAVGMLANEFDTNPAQVDILKALVEMLVDSDRHRAALDILDKAPADPEDPSLALLRAVCLLSLGDTTAAEKIADRLQATDSRRAEAVTLKARIAQSRGDFETAVELFGRAIALKADDGWAHLGLGYIRRDRFHRTDCLECFFKAFQALPRSREVAAALHETAVAMAAYGAAEDAFRQALGRHRIDRRLRFLLIDLLLRQGKLADAMSEVESCLADFGIDEGLLAAALSIRRKIGTMRVPVGEQLRFSVSLCMIVKDEEKHLARCLQSAKPVVDEIIVVDTGSRDRTRDIAAVFGARVFASQWTDDFSEARNYSLSKASGSWIMVLDADEVISPESHQELRSLFHAPDQAPVAYTVQTRNYTHHANTLGWRANTGRYPEERAAGWFPSDKVRIFRNDPRIRFANPVHEMVEDSLIREKIPIRRCGVPVHHYGKLEEEKTRNKTRGYKDLGRKKLNRNRRDRASIKELATQCAHLGEHAEAMRLWQEYLKLEPNSAEAWLNIGTACWNLCRYTEAVAFAEKALRIDPGLIEAGFNQAIGLLMLGRAGEAKPILQEIMDRQPDHPAAQFMLCVACACLGEAGQAAGLIAKIKATPIGPYLDQSFLKAAKRLVAASQFDYARRTIDAAVGLDCGNEEMATLLERCRAAA